MLQHPYVVNNIFMCNLNNVLPDLSNVYLYRNLLFLSWFSTHMIDVLSSSNGIIFDHD